MADSNYDNQFDWRLNLANLHDTGEASFNKELAWNKLHGRLHDKKQNKKFPWYWLAAASVAILIILFLSTNKNEKILVQHQPASNKLKQLTDVQQSAKLPPSKLPVDVALVNVVSSAPAKSYYNANLNNKKILASPSIKSNDFGKQEIINNTTSLVDSTISITANLPLKKMLKVVHVNELGDPIIKPFQYKKYDDNTSSAFRFMNQRVFDNSSVSAKTDHKIFTIKTN